MACTSGCFRLVLVISAVLCTQGVPTTRRNATDVQDSTEVLSATGAKSSNPRIANSSTVTSSQAVDIQEVEEHEEIASQTSYHPGPLDGHCLVRRQVLCLDNVVYKCKEPKDYPGKLRAVKKNKTCRLPCDIRGYIYSHGETFSVVHSTTRRICLRCQNSKAKRIPMENCQ